MQRRKRFKKERRGKFRRSGVIKSSKVGGDEGEMNGNKGGLEELVKKRVEGCKEGMEIKVGVSKFKGG